MEYLQPAAFIIVDDHKPNGPAKNQGVTPRAPKSLTKLARQGCIDGLQGQRHEVW